MAHSIVVSAVILILMSSVCQFRADESTSNRNGFLSIIDIRTGSACLTPDLASSMSAEALKEVNYTEAHCNALALGVALSIIIIDNYR